ncbi:MAG: lysylphosphatidylglycerol synthase domain-containing protein, partial [Rectinemataceae bacterium]
MTKKTSMILGGSLSLVIFLAAAWSIGVKLETTDLAAVASVLGSLSPAAPLAAVLLTLLSYAALVGYDLVAFLHLGKRLPLRQVALTSVLSYVFSNNLSFTLVTGNAIRYQYYSRYGLSGADIARLISLCIATFWVGLFLTGGLALVFKPPSLPSALSGWIPDAGPGLVGAALLATCAAYLLLSLFVRRSVTVFGAEFSFPKASVALLQFLVASVDWIIASLVLFVLLPGQEAIGFPLFFSVFIIAQFAGLLSHVPGGLGVFDAIVLWSFSSFADEPALFGSLLLYRTIYYIIPLFGGFLVHGVLELRRHRERLNRALSFLRTWGTRFVPMVFGLLAAVWGLVSIVTAIDFSTSLDVRWVDFVFSLHVVEYRSTSRLFIGLAFIFLAIGVYKRSDAIYPVGIGVLALEIILSLQFRFPAVVVACLVVLLVLFLPSRSYFNRKSLAIHGIGRPSWIIIVVTSLVLFGSIIGFFTKY